MTHSRDAAQLNESNRRLTLWIDGCGGFRLCCGDHWTVGGNAAAGTCDIAVQTDWNRLAGSLSRSDGEYFWTPCSGDELWLKNESPIPIKGSARMVLRRPSPLSQSAVLILESAHRFVGHVDAVVLVKDTVLVGPGLDCHVRCRTLPERVVLLEKDGNWRIKIGQGAPEAIGLGQRFERDSLALTFAVE